MKQLILHLFFLTFALQLNAQITIDRSDFPLAIGDTSFYWKAVDPSAAPIPSGGEDQFWDYSNLQFDQSIPFRFFHPGASSTDFPEANVINESLTPGIVPGLFFETTFPSILDESGFRTIGRKSAAADVPIESMTGNAGDSLNFLETIVDYKDAVISSSFPLHYKDSLYSEFVLQNDFLVTIAAYGLDHVPANASFPSNAVRKTIGWGTLRLPDLKNGGTVDLEVLLVEDVTTRMDTFVLGGALNPDALLSAFGLVQGFVKKTTEYSFWAKGYNGYVFLLNFENGIDYAEIHHEVAGVIASTSKVDTDLLPLQVSPNPAVDAVNISFEKTDAKAWNLSLWNSLGQAVHQENIGDGRGAISRALALPIGGNGFYFLTIHDAEGQLVASKKIMQTK